MKVRYRGAWSTGFLILATLTLGVAIANIALTGRVSIPPIIPGVVCLVVGIAYRRRHYFELANGELRAPAALGPLVKRYGFEELSQLDVRDNRVWVKGSKTGLSRTLANVEDWQAFERHVKAAETFD